MFCVSDTEKYMKEYILHLRKRHVGHFFICGTFYAV